MKALKVMATAAIATAVLATGSVSAFAAEAATYKSQAGAGFKEFTGTTKPVDPTEPGNEVKPEIPGEIGGPNPEPGTSGPLSIDFASSLYFGNDLEISNQDEIYYAEVQKVTYEVAQGTHAANETVKRPNYVQVSDYRGGAKGWTLNVSQQGQLQNATAQYKELVGSYISIAGSTASSDTPVDLVTPPAVNDVTLDPAGSAVTVMQAAAGKGANTWVDYFGEVANVDVKVGDTTKVAEKNTGVSLSVPGTTPKDTVLYTTTLTWSLSDTVDNPAKFTPGA